MKVVHVEGINMDCVITNRTRCKGCPATVFFTRFPNGGAIPLCQDENGNWINHFDNCPRADDFRKQKELIVNTDMI